MYGTSEHALFQLDIHVKLQKIEIYKKSVINKGTRVYNNPPRFLKETDDYKAFLWCSESLFQPQLSILHRDFQIL